MFNLPVIASLTLLAAVITLSILTVEHENVMYSLFFLFFMNIALGIIFFMFGAPFVALIQFAVFCGAVVVLFILAAIITRGGKWR